DLANQEDCVENDAGDDERKDENAGQQETGFPPIEDHPADVERERAADQSGAQDDEKRDRFSAPAESHVLKDRTNGGATTTSQISSDFFVQTSEFSHQAAFFSSRLSGFLLGGSADLGHADVPHQPADAKNFERDPRRIELVPGQTVAGRRRVGMVVVVPALAEREERDP